MVTLTPAYGRDYASARAAKAAYLAGKDWILNDIKSRYDGKPCGRSDMAGQSVKLRYANLRKVTVVK